ncbi:MAG: S8 family serine peptidase [Bryobacteraceae bacterium]|nr:S8 family serine peptidase [Bryobacteraceae bacterium]
MKQLLSLVLALLLGTVAAAAQVIPGQYILELSEEPALTISGTKEPARAARVQDEQRRIRTMLEEQRAEVLASVSTVANALIVRAPAGSDPDLELARLRALPGVRRVQPDRRVKAYLDYAAPLIAAPEFWQLIGGEDRAGAGVKIAILDTGIDVAHPGFQNSGLSPPEGFPRANRESDLQYTNGKVIVARAYGPSNVSAQDTEGHGTAVAMAAAGNPVNGPAGRITGVAPKAWLGSYKVLPEGRNGSISLVLQGLDDAVNDGMDVINLSLGTSLANRLEEDVLVSAIERAAAAGVIVAVAAGNDGPDPNTIGSPATAPSAIAVGNMRNSRIFSTSVVIEGGPRYISQPGTGSRTSLSAPVRDAAELDPTGLVCSPLPAGSLSGRIALILRGNCLFEQKLNLAQAAGAVGAVIYSDATRPDPDPMGGIDSGSSTLPAAMISYADGLDLKARMKQSPVVAYLDFSIQSLPANPNRLTSSSSRGPSIDSSIKPEIVAPGTSIYTAVPNGYIVASGTSLSAPLVAGAAALLKAARPGLSQEQYRSLLINSSRLPFFGATVPPPVMQAGSGTAHLLASLRSITTVSPVTLSFGVASGTASVSKDFTITNVGPRTDSFRLYVVPISGASAPVLASNEVELQPGQSTGLSLHWNANSLSPGEYQGYILIRSRYSLVDTRLPYWLGVPSGEVRHITILSAPDEAVPPSTLQSIWFRLTDASGIPVTRAQPLASSVQGGGVVLGVEAYPGVPGTYRLQIRTGTLNGTQTFQISAGSMSRTVDLLVRP